MDKLIKLSNYVWYLSGEVETDRPFLYYIKGENCSVAIDAGNSENHVKFFYEELKANNLPLPQVTIITHWHWDHTFGIPFISGKAIASADTNKKLEAVSRWNWTPEDMESREKSGEDIAFCNQCILKEYPDLSKITVKPAEITVSENTVMNLGGITLQLIPRDSTHSRDALFIYLQEEKMLFVGDGDCEDHYENQGKYDKQRLKSMLEFIESIDCDRYLLGHDEPTTKAETLSYLEECYNSI